LILATTLTCSNCGGNDTVTLLAAVASIVVAIATFGVVVVTFLAARAAVRSARATEGLLATQLAPRLINVEAADKCPSGPGTASCSRPPTDHDESWPRCSDERQ
jgi:hypothetical protein